jgi:NADPH:quinone reductase-like Zn-dependent oxidoreductase
MKAVVAGEPGGPEVLHVEEVPIPEPGPGQVRIRVAYASLNPLDIHARAARVEYKAPTFPYIPGYEFAGLVDRVGEGVDPGLVSRRVAFLGYPGGCATVIGLCSSEEKIEFARPFGADHLVDHRDTDWVEEVMRLTGGRELPEIHEALRSGRWRIPIARVWEYEEVAELHRRFEERALLGKQLIRAAGEI